MTYIKLLITCFLAVSFLVFTGCKTMTKSQKGAVIGTAGGGVAGAVIGKATGNTTLGAIIGATVGGVAGAVIGQKMDKQAEEIKKAHPDAIVERVGEGIVVEFTDKILFGFDQHSLSSLAKTNLDKVVAVLIKYPDTDIVVQGHTDSKGTEKYNQDLSERRAAAVSDYLLYQNVAAARLTTIGYGENTPKYSNNDSNGQMQNRRVEFLITANEKMKADAQLEASKSGGE